jgi:hypothetical protein
MSGDRRFGQRVVEHAWRELPAEARSLLEAIRAHAWKVTDRPLGTYTDDLRRSGGFGALSASDRRRADGAVGLWLPEPRLVLVNVAHPSLRGLDESTLAYALARVAWHEWAHALSIHRATEDDVAAGKRLLACVPPALAENVRSSGYLRREYTHEIVAEIYAMLMTRHRFDGATDKPSWLSQEVYELVRRVAGWNR